MTDLATPDLETAVDAAAAGWGTEAAAAVPVEPLRHFRFRLGDGSEFTHLDITGAEALKMEAEFGIDWGLLRPKGCLAHGMGFLRVFLARTHPGGADGAAKVVAAMTVGQIEDAIVPVYGAADDLPDQFEDGLPKVVKAAP